MEGQLLKIHAKKNARYFLQLCKFQQQKDFYEKEYWRLVDLRNNSPFDPNNNLPHLNIIFKDKNYTKIQYVENPLYNRNKQHYQQGIKLIDNIFKEMEKVDKKNNKIIKKNIIKNIKKMLLIKYQGVGFYQSQEYDRDYPTENFLNNIQI